MKKFDSSRVDAIHAKMQVSGSDTADYATALFQSFLQTRTAQKPRQDALQKLIIDIVNAQPDISAKELMRQLERQKGQGVILEITSDDTIRFVMPDGKESTAQGSGLKDRLGRAKKYLNKNSR